MRVERDAIRASGSGSEGDGISRTEAVVCDGCGGREQRVGEMSRPKGVPSCGSGGLPLLVVW